jgi:hypothetical protein
MRTPRIRGSADRSGTGMIESNMQQSMDFFGSDAWQ